MQQPMFDRHLSLSTPRLVLRPWREADRAQFADLHADQVVMDDLGGAIDRDRANHKFERYRRAWDDYGFGRWAVTKDQQFIGYVGVMPRRDPHPLGAHDEIGWRLGKDCWGQGYASEAARAALDDIFTRVGLPQVLAYTSRTNPRSRAVMQRLQFRRSQKLDFTMQDAQMGEWHGLVWKIEAHAWAQLQQPRA